MVLLMLTTPQPRETMLVSESNFLDAANVVFHEDYAWQWHAVKVIVSPCCVFTSGVVKLVEWGASLEYDCPDELIVIVFLGRLVLYARCRLHALLIFRIIYCD